MYCCLQEETVHLILIIYQIFYYRKQIILFSISVYLKSENESFIFSGALRNYHSYKEHSLHYHQNKMLQMSSKHLASKIKDVFPVSATFRLIRERHISKICLKRIVSLCGKCNLNKNRLNE